MELRVFSFLPVCIFLTPLVRIIRIIMSLEQSTTGEPEVNNILQNATAAFAVYSKKTGAEKAAFLEAIATALESKRLEMVQNAQQETNLPEARLNGELSRTTNQLKMFARLVNEGSWLEAAIDTADPQRTPAKPDTRKMLTALGPVVVFGASNFPFAFSTAGGDTASVLAAGCPVIVKAHFAHPKTSALAFAAIQEAILATGMHPFTVQHAFGDNNFAKELVIHPSTAAVTFTGSLAGGRALYDYAVQRKNPIPVFAEMSSINPVVFYPDLLATDTEGLAKKIAGSFTLGVGQFCTKPGLLLAVKGSAADSFIELIKANLSVAVPQKMLHSGIAKSYHAGLSKLGQQENLAVTIDQDAANADTEALPVLAVADVETFMANQALQHELFGPYALVVLCNDKNQLTEVLTSLEGQLTSTLMASEKDIEDWADVVALQSTLAGRVILNDAPTGVEVNASMVHGGAYPATTDARFTSVGASAIKRFARPVCYQGFTNSMLPAELKDENPLNIWRIVNNEFTKDKV
jgi:alpha-ketoglutaric semialdehyde dehydrogenase